MIGAHGFEDAQHTNGIYIGRKLGRIKTHLHVALRGEVVDFRGLHLANEFDQRHRVGHVGIVKVEAGLAFEVGNALAVVHGRTADDAVHFVVLGQEKLGKITAILSRHTRNQGNVLLIFHIILSLLIRNKGRKITSNPSLPVQA